MKTTSFILTAVLTYILAGGQVQAVPILANQSQQITQSESFIAQIDADQNYSQDNNYENISQDKDDGDQSGKKQQKDGVAAIHDGIDESEENNNENIETQKPQEELSLAQILTEALSSLQISSLVTIGASSETESTAESQSGIQAKLRSSSSQMFNYVSSLRVDDANTPVSQAHVIFLIVFSFVSILGCCCSTTICVRAARDSNIAVSALNIRRKQLRHFQLQALVKEKMQIDAKMEKRMFGNTASPSDYSISITEETTNSDIDVSQSQQTSNNSYDPDSYEQSSSYENAQGIQGLMHPSDIIMEQSREEDDSYLIPRAPQFGAYQLDIIQDIDQESGSLAEDDSNSIIVDTVTEQYRANKKSSPQKKRSFFEENLMAAHAQQLVTTNVSVLDPCINEDEELKDYSPALGLKTKETPLVNLTDCSEVEDDCGNERQSANFYLETNADSDMEFI